MAVLDGPMGAVAKTLLGTFGRAATLNRGGTKTYNPATLTTSESGATTVPCSVAFSDFRESEIDGTIIQAGDRKALVSRLALGVEPRPNRDTLTVGSDTWRIINLRGYSSGAQEAAYELQVRM